MMNGWPIKLAFRLDCCCELLPMDETTRQLKIHSTSSFELELESFDWPPRSHLEALLLRVVKTLVCDHFTSLLLLDELAGWLAGWLAGRLSVCLTDTSSTL